MTRNCDILMTYACAPSCWPYWSLGLGSCSSQCSSRTSVPVGTESGTGSEAWGSFCWTWAPLIESGASYNYTSRLVQSWGWWAEPVCDCPPLPGKTLWKWLLLDRCLFATGSIGDCGVPPPGTRPGVWPLQCLCGQSCGTQIHHISVSISALSSVRYLNAVVYNRWSLWTAMWMKHCWWTPPNFQHLCSCHVGLI